MMLARQDEMGLEYFARKYYVPTKKYAVSDLTQITLSNGLQFVTKHMNLNVKFC